MQHANTEGQSYTNPFFDGIYVLDSDGGYYFNNGEQNIVSDVRNKKNNFILTLGWKFFKP